MENEVLRHVIYGLFDPITGDLRYIGYTSDKEDRIKAHHRNCNLRNCTHKENWIKSIKNKELKAEMHILRGCLTAEELPQAEKDEIAYWKKLKFNLTNATDGGDGQQGLKHSEETKKKISEAVKGKKMPESQRQATSKRMKGNKIGLGKKFPPKSEEAKRKISETQRGELNAATTLTYEDVSEIKRLVLKGVKRKEIGKLYGMTSGGITLIVNGRNWKYHTEYNEEIKAMAQLKYISQEIKNAAIEDYKSGIGYELLAKKYKISTSIIWEFMPKDIKRSLKIGDKNLWDDKKIIQDYIAGMTYKELSKKYKIGITALIRRIPKEVLRGNNHG